MIEFVERAIACRTVQELWDIQCAIAAERGFPRLIYGYTRSRSGKSLGDPSDAMILSNHDPRYLRGFIEKRMYLHAPMTRWCMMHTGACSWRWVDAQEKLGLLSADERRVHAFNLRHGLTAGYTISFLDISQRDKAAMSLGTAPGLSHDAAEALWREHGRALLAICNVAHLRYLTLPHTGARRPLTPRQREALEWIGQGMTTADAAERMRLTPATVEKHLRLAREALGVDTTAQAVLKAGVQNQIYVL